METLFYLAAAVAVVSTVLMITRMNAVSALLYLIVSLFAVALVFLLLGAPFVAALEVLTYAGAVMVLFVFVVMLFNVAHWSRGDEQRWLASGAWLGPLALCLVLAGELLWLIAGGAPGGQAAARVGPAAVGAALYGPYLLSIELVSLLLLAGLVGAYHLGRREEDEGSERRSGR